MSNLSIIYLHTNFEIFIFFYQKISEINRKIILMVTDQKIVLNMTFKCIPG